MSLLEDVFLENEAGEAQELERIIEGDEYDDRPRNLSDSDENSAKEDEAEEDKRRVDPTSAKPKRVIKNPRFVLNPARLTGPRGIQVLPEHFKDFKFKGKGHEKDDLDLVLKKLEHWAYRLYPKFQFQDCLKKIETLGKKRAVSVHLTKIRLDLVTSEETVVQRDSSEDEGTPAQAAPEEDEFDKLLQQQIEIARATPAPSSLKKTPFSDRPSIMPEKPSSPSINEEQRERMLRNRRMAEERRLAKLRQNTPDKPSDTEIAVTPVTINNASIGKELGESNTDVNKSVVSDTSVGNNLDIGNKVDTVDLDTNGEVTNSPDYATQHKHGIFDGSNINDTVELDDDGMVVNKSPKTYASAKKRPSRIVSSDGDSLGTSEPVTVHVEKHHDGDYEMDSSDDDRVISEPITIDVDHHHDNITMSKKYSTSNVIDSSDEDESIVMNESITVDIHSNKHDTDASNILYSHTSNIQDKDAGIIHDTDGNIMNTENKNKNAANEITDSIAENKQNDSSNISKIDITSNSNTKKNSLEAKDPSESEVSIQIVEKNVSAMESEIMEVDFSDEF